jgi:hypothetical protein
VLLSLTAFVSHTAFANANLPRVQPLVPDGKGKKIIAEDLKETEHEKGLRERKVALNRLLDRVNLNPTVRAGAAGAKGKGVSKRSMLEAYSQTLGKKSGSGDEDDGEEKELNENQLNQVCAAFPL